MATDKTAQYAKAAAGLPGISVKGDTVSYTSVSGLKPTPTKTKHPAKIR